MPKTILTIEDDFFLQGLEVTRFKKEGFTVLAALNSKDFFLILEKKPKIDLILLDLMLPDMNGFELLKIIKKEKSLLGVPIIVFSNLSEEKDIEKAKKIGITEFLIKSNFRLDQLVSKVRELIGP